MTGIVLLASQLSRKLLQKGGNSIETECRSNPKYQSNECRVTTGGNTQFQYIVHFITPESPVLAQNLKIVLDLIEDKLKSTSVAIPAIGAGGYFALAKFCMYASI